MKNFCGCGRPRLLDIFCGAGGASRGYVDAGFCVTGVDINRPSSYGGNHFVEGDAFDYLADHAHEYAAIHASPPCQHDSMLTQGNRHRDDWWNGDHTDMITPTRISLSRVTVPTVIENVAASTVRRDLTLCGLMFGLGVFRHRWFEFEHAGPVPVPVHPSHAGHRVSGWRHGVNHAGDMRAVYGDGGGKGTVPEWQTAMGIDWTSDRLELAEAIPPAYTRFIGNFLLGKVTQ